MSTTLRLDRRLPTGIITLGDRHRSWQILLDGAKIGQIAPNGAYEAPIEPGTHTLRLTSTDKRQSPERTFTAGNESMVEFRCHVQPVWPLMLMALVIPGRWIALKQQ